jgi:hypothetical protein
VKVFLDDMREKVFLDDMRDVHDWVVTETGHPFMTGYTCRKCKRKCGVLDDESPHLDEPCEPSQA